MSARDQIVVLKTEYLTLELVLGSLLHSLLNLVIADRLVETAGKVNDGDVRGGHTHGHAGELSVQRWDNLADSLGGTGAAGNDVLSSGTATTPVLGGRAIDGLLGRSVGVDGGHQTLNQTKVVVDNFGQWGKAVGCARGVGKDLDIGLVFLVVDTHNKHGSIGGWGGDDDLLGTALQVSAGLLLGCEHTGGFDDVFGTGLRPGDAGRVPGLVEFDVLSVDVQTAVGVLDLTVESAVGGVVLEHVGLYE